MARLVARVYTFAEMSILRYFKPKDSLPDPKGSLSASMSSEAIASANQEVQEAMASSAKGKRGPYTKYVCIHIQLNNLLIFYEVILKLFPP